MTVTIAPARPADAAAISSILLDWVDETDWLPRAHSRREHRRFGAFLIGRMDVLVARRSGRVTGFLANDGGVIHALYLAPGERGLGTGKALLDRVRSRQDRVVLWTYQANARARAFYRREGFAEVEQTDGADNDERLPDVRLVWKAGEGDG